MPAARGKGTRNGGKQTAAQRAAAKKNLAKGEIKPGEVRNPKGHNGWTKARERVREMLAKNAEGITAAAIEQALAGDDKAARLLLGPLLPAQKHEHEHSGEVSFKWSE